MLHLDCRLLSFRKLDEKLNLSLKFFKQLDSCLKTRNFSTIPHIK